MGKDCVEFCDQLFLYRFKPVHDNYLNVLRAKLQDDVRKVDVPPIASAFANTQVFADEVTALGPKMEVEIKARMREWVELADKAGIRSEFDKYIHNEIQLFCDNLADDGMRLMAAYEVPLKDADKAWRLKNPELSKKWPVHS